MNIRNWSVHCDNDRYGERRRCCRCDLPVKALAMCLGVVLIVRGIVGGWSAFFADQGHSAAFPLLIGSTIVAYAAIDLAFTVCALVGVVGAARDQIFPTHIAFRIGILLTVASAVDGIVNVVFSVLARSAYLEQCVGPGNDSDDMGNCMGTWNVDIAATVVAWVGNLVINMVSSGPALPLRHDFAPLVSCETQSSPIHEYREPERRSVEDEQRIRMEIESIRTEMDTVKIARPLVKSSDLQSSNAGMSKLESPRLVDRDSGVFIPMHMPTTTPIPTPPMSTSVAIASHKETSPNPALSWHNPINPASTSRPLPPAHVRSHHPLMGPRAPRRALSSTYQPHLDNVGIRE
ncbi:hypothetical protein BC937DRAFT_86378 [Endogone sp. FLAS-F59071]|nr:hypothetical protein BC937DRAFT_86378 [Endogone sp. FLAS-F59071]|eukprot:RUS20087.1 hypothetical protein BC937DRAFT_86378 [Endogone sp. FLAS-F59071]